MDSAVCSHHVYKSVWLPVTEQLTVNPHDELAVHGSNKELSDSWHSIRNLFTCRSHGIILHKGALSPTDQRLSYYWEKEERTDLKFHVNIITIVDPQKPQR